MQFFLKTVTLKGAKFAKTLPLWKQNTLSGPTLKGAKSKKNTDPFRGSIRGDQMYGSTPPPPGPQVTPPKDKIHLISFHYQINSLN